MAEKLLAELQPHATPQTEESDKSLLRRFRCGSQEAAAQLYQRYAGRVHSLARARCPPRLSARVDAEDIVQSVFRSFFQAARRGLYQVPAGDELWKILVVIAIHKISSQRSFHQAAKRDVRLTASNGGSECNLEDLQQAGAAFPLLQVAIKDALETLAPQQRQMLEMRIQGFEVAQIAQQTKRSKRSVERVLQEVRNQLKAIFHEAE